MRNGFPFISVVIPAYNEQLYISACLQSFRNQTFPHFELVVVDNNSTDNTAKIALHFKARVVKELKQGIIPARERGFQQARAEIIARTDADTIVSPDWLELIYKEFVENPHAVGISGGLLSPDPRLSDKRFLRCINLYARFGKILMGHYPLFGPNMAIRKSAWEKITVHFDDKKVHEDIDLACHLAEVGEILYIPHITTRFSMRKFHEDTIKGAARYFIEYPIRYIHTIHIHHPIFRRKKKIKQGLLPEVRKPSEASSA